MVKIEKKGFVVVATQGPAVGYCVATSMKRTDTAEDNLTMDPTKMRLYGTEKGAQKIIETVSYRKFAKQGGLEVRPVTISVQFG